MPIKVKLILERKMELYIYNILLVCYFIILIAGVVKGSGENRSIIVFRNYDDLGLTFLIPIIGLLVVDKSGSYFNPKNWLAGRRVGSSVRNNI